MTEKEPREIIARAQCADPDECVHGSGWVGSEGSGFECHIRAWQTKLPAADAILSALDEAGWVCVPKEPTKEMVVAGDDEKENCIDSGWDSDADGNRYDYTTVNSDIAARIYRAMLAAATERRNALKKENRE